MDKELLVKRLKELSEEKKITLTKAFIESGVGKNFISNMKTSNPSMGKITMLANYFNVSVDYLLGNTDKKVCMTFIDRIEKLLIDTGISKKTMLNDLSLGINTFSNWKNRGTIPSGETLQKIADYFGVTVDYLLGKEPTPSEVGEALDFNTVIIRGRDGNVVTKKLSNEQIKVLEAIIDQFPDAPDDL